MGAERKMAGDEQLVAFIVKYRDDNGVPPSLQTIADEFGVAKSTAHLRVEDLIQQGALARASHLPIPVLRVTEVGMKMVTEPMS